MSDTRPSPIDGREVPFESQLYTQTFHRFDLSGQRIADLYVSEQIAVSVKYAETYRSGVREYSVPEVKAALTLIRSKLWRVRRSQSLNICILTESEYATVIRSPKQYPSANDFILLSFEQQIQEAKDLTFTQKCLETLKNIHTVWTDVSEALFCHGWPDANNAMHFTRQSGPEDGMAYGCDNCEAPLAFSYLYNGGLIELDYVNGQFNGFSLSPKGYVEIDHLRRGNDLAVKRAFLIRRYDVELDKFLRPIMDEVQRLTSCEVKAVWEIEHNEKIDDRILRLIRESSLVVLDIDPTRFNVGLEAGYALALHKPIVAIRERPTPWVSPPFDIATLNCFDYDRSNSEQLIGVVSERILAALEEVRLSLIRK